MFQAPLFDYFIEGAALFLMPSQLAICLATGWLSGPTASLLPLAVAVQVTTRTFYFYHDVGGERVAKEVSRSAQLGSPSWHPWIRQVALTQDPQGTPSTSHNISTTWWLHC